ncbi:FecR family protein [Chitinophaga niabensis]|uniref:Ferric-dicitrate binding protein FerR, regulates iron transport through sigma-19 n=1 Tax=Chitinophaga niabensis TaxID=536979 RepID=A0A1N6DVC4_9BACT|nr:FecR family protein [Chitinophaga niabensis]SIN74739.1 ferric-dicitrate binding protein FerR, regulates iron transport through sigma-19 [Chitinophaga niabensis]
MDHQEEKIHALLLDNRFVDWVINPQSPYAGYWLQWAATDPEHAWLLEEAKHFLLEMRLAEEEGQQELSEVQLEQMLDRIREEIAPVPQKRSIAKYWYMAAAVLAGAIALGIFMFSPKENTITGTDKKEAYSTDVIRYNGNKEDELLFLPDGSKVVLAKGARISYNMLMNGSKREVTLSGEAFFDVAKNAEQPFYIYTKNVVVKVLGTSFKVTASGNQEAVAVKTGKVSVYLKGQDLEQSAARIVLPQQVCRYSENSKELITETFTDKLPIASGLEKARNYNFEDAPLDSVIKTLEKMYAIPIQYNADTFAGCFITISLGDESLEEILKVITRTVDASYSYSGYGITLKGKGCR